MKRNYILSILTVVMLLPFTTIKAQYDAGDSTVCYNIMTNNFTANNLLNWSDPNPANWLGVIWNTSTPKRIIQLELEENGGDMGTVKGGNVGLALQKYTNINGSGVNSQLTGALDFSALTELFALDLRDQELISSINFTGLNSLEYFIMCDTDSITALDMSNLPNLQHIHTSNMDAILTIDASNCPRLKKLMVKRGNATLTNVNISGSDSLRFINIESSVSNTSPQTSLDLTGKTELYHLNINDDGNFSSFPGLQFCSKLTSFRVDNNNLTGTININDFDTANFWKLEVDDNQLDAIIGWTSQITNGGLERMRADNNHLTLKNAIQLANEVNNNGSIDLDPQTRYGGDTIPVGTTLDYSSEALIAINGVNVASTFQLFDNTGTQVGASNATGIFTFPNVGEFYIEMTNPGAAPNNEYVKLTTNNFWVRCVSASGTQALTICAGDTASVDGVGYSATGSYYNYYTVPGLCDSVYISDITVKPAIKGSQSATLCFGTPFTVGSSTYTTPGKYFDVFTAADGCDSTVTTNLNYFPKIDTSITMSGPTLISNNIFVPTITYQWVDCNNGNAPIANATNPTFTPTSTGSYAVVLSEGGCSDISSCYSFTIPTNLTGLVTNTICATGSIVVNGNTYDATSPVGIEIFTNVGPFNLDSTVIVNLTVLAPIDISTTTSNNTISSNATGATYQWIDCSTNNSIAGETGQNFTATVDGDYAVVVTIGNCADTSACVNIATVGINELNNGNTVSVYPNPTTGSVSLNFGEVLNAGSVIITDITGKQVYVLENLNTQTLSIDVNHFSNGVYFVKIQNNNQLKVIKFIKQ